MSTNLLRAVTDRAPSDASGKLDLAVVDILIVDDNPKNMLALEATLEPLGQNIVRADSGTQALRCCLERDFALVLLDIQMPGMDGFETAKLIRSRERSRQTPIIFLTAFGTDDAQVARAYELGAVDFLQKPITPFIVCAKVRAFVDLHRKTLEIKRQAVLLRDIEHERQLAEAAQAWEARVLREEMIKERTTAATLAKIIADRERAEAALKVSHDRLTVLSDVAIRLLVDDDPAGSLDSLLRRLADHLSLEVYLGYRALDDGKTLALEVAAGIEPALSRSTRVSPIEPVAALVATSRQRVIADHVQQSKDKHLGVARSWGLDTYACFPLVAHGRLLGTLAFGTRHRPQLEPDELAVMQAVCDQVAIAFERVRLIAELSIRNRELGEAAKRKDEFLAMLAHELRNPMAPIVNAVHLLGLPDVAPAVVSNALATLNRQAGHMVRLVDDLLDLSRITRGQIELRREAVTVASIVNHAIQTSAPLMAKWQHVFDATIPDEEIFLFADPTRVGQVLANLLNNAAKYSPPGSKIDLEVEHRGDEVVIRVRDRGIGIRPEMLDAVFGLFVQCDRTTERAQGGLGVGLTLVKSLVELHGGTVEAYSAGLGQGSQFAVRLPIADAEVQVPAPAPAVCSSGGESRSVLVVEDNEDISETMRDMIEYSGHRVAIASDGPSAVEAVLSMRPDIAFVDIGLPGFDGYDVAAAIRARAPDLPTRLVALTGYGTPEDRERALAAGFDEHMVKPVTFADVLERIEA